MLFTYDSLVDDNFTMLKLFDKIITIFILDSFVFFYDGNVKCYEHGHLLLTILSISSIILLILPPPILVILAVHGVVTVSTVISDALRQGYRLVHTLVSYHALD